MRRVRLKYVADITAGQSPESADVTYAADGLPFLQGCAEFGAKFPASEKYCLNPPKTAQKGSWLISVRAPVGSLNLADQDYCIGRGLAAVSPGAVDRGYLGYLLLNKSGFLNAISTGSTFQAISTFQLQNLELELPPLTTQQLIAQFLDEKTAQIDGLIEKKRALLDRLAEKRQALITRAVTKGLNPDAPMKPSGIDWLGDIPSHWEVLPLKRAVQYQEGPGIMAVDFRDEGVPLLRVASIGGRYATLNGVNYLEPEMANGKWGHFLTEVGDLLISASATSGIVSEVTEETSGCIPYTGIIRVNPIDGEADSSFLRNLLVSDVFLSQIDQLKAGSTIQHFGPYHLGLMVIAKPPLSEQKAISQVLDNAIEDLDYAEGEVRKSVELLSEYRSALLTSAVTGQIGDLG